jgi:hypothetical protein
MVSLFNPLFILLSGQVANSSIIVYLEEPGRTSSSGDGPVPEDEEAATI